MFYELIYTRCRQGMDITRKGAQISGDGYKVYSCTPAIFEEGKVDLQFLVNAAQAKQSFTDPGFMDEAYLYYVPDVGPRFFVNFSPILFDANATGDYSRRPGNFVNHVILGDFSAFYPYELFKDENTWNAKTKGEAYYYETPPVALPARGDISDPLGQYSFDEIGAFIKDGREEALKKAVSFIISQYKEESEKRKYLVIKDESSRNIELWIAAIQCAFSPKIASAIPFATRMDKFANINKYTAKQGLYQPQINLQDPNHKHRFRAMIIGVDERDKVNVGSSRPLANSQFVLLDGKQKQAMFDADTSNQYYNFIIRFDDEHRDFCRISLQDTNILNSNADILDFYEVFSILAKPALPAARALSDCLYKLSKYMETNSKLLKRIYDNVSSGAYGYLQENTSDGLSIINWLMLTSRIFGDNNAKQNFTRIVCDGFTELVFQRSDNTAKKDSWSQISRSDFAVDVANIITNKETIKKHDANLKTFMPADMLTFINIYLEAIGKTGVVEQSDVSTHLRMRGCIACFQVKDTSTLKEIILVYSKKENISEQELLLSLAKTKNEDYNKFLIEYLITSDTSITASEKSLVEFLEKLNDELLKKYKAVALKNYIKNLNKPADIESILKILLETSVKEQALSEIFVSLEAKFGLDSLNEYLIKSKHIDKEGQFSVLDALYLSPEGYFSKYVETLIGAANKNRERWNYFYEYASKKKDEKISDIIVRALLDTRQNEKTLKNLSSYIEDDNVRKKFDDISEKVQEIMTTQEKKSLLGRLFGGKAQ